MQCLPQVLLEHQQNHTFVKVNVGLRMRKISELSDTQWGRNWMPSRNAVFGQETLMCWAKGKGSRSIIQKTKSFKGRRNAKVSLCGLLYIGVIWNRYSLKNTSNVSWLCSSYFKALLSVNCGPSVRKTGWCSKEMSASDHSLLSFLWREVKLVKCCPHAASVTVPHVPLC